MVLTIIKEWLIALLTRNSLFTRRRKRGARPWQLRVQPKTPVAMTLQQSDVDRLLQRHRDLKDMEKLATVAGSFHLPESDFFADPKQIERLIRHFLDQNPPWLHVGKVLPSPNAQRNATGTESRTELLWRERVTREIQDVTLFVPADNWRDLPLSSLTLRPARHLSEIYQARMLDQILPPILLVDRLSRGEILIPNRNRVRHRLEFEAQERQIETIVRKPLPVPIETESAGDGADGQLLYILLDYSASMQGKSATLALAAIMATLRANIGRNDTRYLFRRYALEENIWPREIEPPLQARNVAEKDAFLDTILETNFNGGATHVNHALSIAATDVENLRRNENLETTLLLVTDGRAEILESTLLRLKSASIKLHTVMVTPEPNPGLQAISESFTALDIQIDSTESNSNIPGMTEIPRVHTARI